MALPKEASEVPSAKKGRTLQWNSEDVSGILAAANRSLTAWSTCKTAFHWGRVASGSTTRSAQTCVLCKRHGSLRFICLTLVGLQSHELAQHCLNHRSERQSCLQGDLDPTRGARRQYHSDTHAGETKVSLILLLIHCLPLVNNVKSLSSSNMVLMWGF